MLIRLNSSDRHDHFFFCHSTASELSAIKNPLQGLAVDVGSVKASHDSWQVTVEQLGVRMSEAETRISTWGMLTKANHQTNGDSSTSKMKKLPGQNYLLWRRINIRVIGIPVDAEMQDLTSFVLSLLAEKAELDVVSGFEVEQVHRASPTHFIRFLRFSGRANSYFSSRTCLNTKKSCVRTIWCVHKVFFIVQRQFPVFLFSK